MTFLRVVAVVCCLVSPIACSAAVPVAGDWEYYFAELLEPDGKTYKSSVSGMLKLTADGKFEQSRKIGSVQNTGKGTYTTKENQIVLKYSDGSKSDTYTFSMGEHTDSKNVKFDALTLVSKSKDGGGFRYLLIKAKQ